MGEIKREEVPDEINSDKDPAKKTPDEQVISEEEILASVESKVEEELSREVIEKIMEKVKDIEEKGLAYTCLTTHRIYKESRESIEENLARKLTRLESTLSAGILSGISQDDKESNISTKEWRQKAAERNKRVHFNIVGRSTPFHGEEKDDTRTEIGRYYRSRSFEKKEQDFSLTLIFNIKGFRETEPTREHGNPRVKTYHANDPDIEGPLKMDHASWWEPPITEEELTDEFLRGVKRSKEGLPMPHTEYGFVLSPRVSPRRFEGLVLQADSELMQQITRQLSEIITKVNKDKPERIIPIYDKNGNLLWPKQMTHEEIKALVGERDKNKKETKEQS